MGQSGVNASNLDPPSAWSANYSDPVARTEDQSIRRGVIAPNDLFNIHSRRTEVFVTLLAMQARKRTPWPTLNHISPAARSQESDTATGA